MTMHKTFQKFLKDELEAPKATKNSLEKVKDEIREHLRVHLPISLKMFFNDYTPEFTVPKFRTQGSWSHGTLNMPAYPSQHIDIDDGVYVRIEYLKDKAEPVTGGFSEGMFNAAQHALRPLCHKNKWSLIDDIDTCVRINLNNGAHVDIPLYATPDDTYITLEAKHEAALAKSGFLDFYSRSDDVLEWGMLDKGEVLLAHRKLGWIASDPGPVTKWVKQRARHHGAQFLDVVRYIKAWRDWQWESGGPSSICLMVVAERAFKMVKNNDELSLLKTLELMPEYISQKVKNPGNEEEDLAEKLDKNGTRQDVINKLSQFHLWMKNATENTYEAQSILEQCFGERFPKIIMAEVHSAAAAAVLSTPPHKVDRPIVKRTRSGQSEIIKRSHSG